MQIRSAGIDGRKTKWGDPVYFIVSEEKLDLPLAAPSRLSSTVGKSGAVVIRWNKVNNAIAYQVQIGLDKQFDKLVEIKNQKLIKSDWRR